VILTALAFNLAQAQATRTWVSGVGDDANPCSRTAPCLSFAGAMSKTAPGGEIDALDPAVINALTITKAITIDGGGGQVASISASGSSGIVVQAGANDVVTLKNLRIQGGGSGNGIDFLSGKALHVENCTIAGFAGHGINVAGGNSLFVAGSSMRNNGGAGLKVAGTASVSVNNSHFNYNQWGVVANDGSAVAVRDSEASGNTAVGFLAVAQASPVDISLTDSSAVNNQLGIMAGGGAAFSFIRMSGVSVHNNAAGLMTGLNGSIQSFGNNYITDSGAPDIGVPGGSLPTGPSIEGVAPAQATAAGPAFELTVDGTGFATTATVQWNGSDRTTTWISSKQLQAAIGAADIATVGTADVAVNNPAPNGGVSGTYKFAINSPATAGFTVNTTSGVILNVIQGQSTTLSVTFSGSVKAAQISATCINLPPGVTCKYDSSTATVTISTSPTTPRGSYQIGVIFTVTQLASVRRNGLLFAAYGGLLGLPLGAVWIAVARGGKRRRWALILPALLLVAVLASCGGSSTPVPPGTQSTVAVTLNVK
jgi:hypothetical protein